MIDFARVGGEPASDLVRAAIIGGHRKRRIALEFVEYLRKIPRPHRDRYFGLDEIVGTKILDAKRIGDFIPRHGNDLEQTVGIGMRNRIVVKRRFDVHDGPNELGMDAVALRRGADCCRIGMRVKYRAFAAVIGRSASLFRRWRITT